MARFEREPSEYIEKVVATNRVSKTVKGGRVMKFSALMVVGDGKGKVGFGLGKAAEVPEAIRKGIEDAKKNMITVSLSGSTIPHEIIGEAGAGRVLMKPAAPGTGVIAGGPVRIIMEAAGIKDIRTKCLRSNTAVNVVAATFEGLKALRTPEEVARTRGKSVDEIVGTAVDQNGTPYYKVKNSWAQVGPYDGYWYFSRPFVAYKTMTVLVNKNGVPKEILKKIGIK